MAEFNISSKSENKTTRIITITFNKINDIAGYANLNFACWNAIIIDIPAFKGIVIKNIIKIFIPNCCFSEEIEPR